MSLNRELARGADFLPIPPDWRADCNERNADEHGMVFRDARIARLRGFRPKRGGLPQDRIVRSLRVLRWCNVVEKLTGCTRAVAGLPTEPRTRTAGLLRILETSGRGSGMARDPRRAFVLWVCPTSLLEPSASRLRHSLELFPCCRYLTGTGRSDLN